MNTIENLASRPRYEALTTRTVRFNYTNASSVAASLQSRLSRDCGVQPGGELRSRRSGDRQSLLVVGSPRRHRVSDVLERRRVRGKSCERRKKRR